MQEVEPELNLNPLCPLLARLPPRQCIKQNGLGLLLGERKNIMPQNVRKEFQVFKIYIKHNHFFSFLIINQEAGKRS